MIIEIKENIDIQNIGVTTENIEANINSASMPFLFEMLSGSLYSNSIGSICREITSNCFDSHVEAKVDDPVTIKKGNDEEGIYISFIDIGTGLSPDRIRTIYMSYFSSTKREDNSQIGGFGLGSKSPLSYSDYFYIITNFNNIKYQYIFSKGKHVPILDLISKSETIDRNGTEIRIYIKDSWDVDKFRIELTKQLCYFDNVYFENWNIENDYTIFEGTYFKYRNKHQYDTKMHIVLDKVVYPIDWKQLGISEYNIAVGVKFQIGELFITPNREQIRYTDETIVLIKERIKQTIDELVNIFNNQNKQFDSFFEWLEKKNEKPFISFTKENGEVNKLYLYGLEYVNKKNIYKYFEGIEDIKNINDLLSLFFGYIGKIKNGKKKKENYTSDITYKIKYNASDCYISNTLYTNSEKDWLVGNGHIIYPRLNLKNYKNIFLNITKNDNNICNLNKYYFNLGVSIKIYKLMKAIREEVKSKCKVYRELTEEELVEYKAYKRENNSSLQKRLNGKISVDSISERVRYDWKLRDINSYTGIIIYGFKEDEEKLRKAITIFHQVRNKYLKFDYNFKYCCNDKAFKIIKISKTNERYFKKRKNMTYVNNLYNDNPIFRDMASSFKIECFFDNIEKENKQRTLDYIKNIKFICTYIGEVLEELYNFYIKTNNTDDYELFYKRDHIKTEVMQIAEQHNLYNPHIELLFNKVNNWFKGVEIIRYININDKTLPFILKLLYEKKKRLNVEYYQKVLNTDKSQQLEIDFNKVEQPNSTKFQVITQNTIV